MKWTLTTLFLVMFSFGVAAQHANTWFRLTASVPINENLKTDIEWQHRRQNDVDSYNPFEKNLMYALRTWISYQPGKSVTYSASPFAYFSNYKLIQHDGDANAHPTREYRFTGAVELRKDWPSPFTLSNRTAIEYRIFEGVEANVTRARNRLSLKYDVNTRWAFSVGNELFFNVWGVDGRHHFDHDRSILNVTYTTATRWKFDLGYIYASRWPKNNLEVISENNLFLQCQYTFRSLKRQASVRS